jgi:chromate transporter
VDATDRSGGIGSPSPRALFLAFLTVGVTGFGGVLPFARRMLVDRKAWLTPQAFNETLALCQSLPGPNIVNMSVVVGARFAGPKGALAAVTGLVGAPVVIVTTLGMLYGAYGDLRWLHGAITGLGAAASGLVAATAARMAVPLLRRRPWRTAPFIILAFVGVGVFRLSLPWVLLALAPLGIAVAWRWRA